MSVINADFSKSGSSLRTEHAQQAQARTFLHQGNADYEDLRVCHPVSRRPIARPTMNETYPLLAYYAGGKPHYYENARVMFATDPETGKMLDAATTAWGVGIYVESKQASVTALHSFKPR